MRNKIPFILFIFSFAIFLKTVLFSHQNNLKTEESNSFYYPNTSIKFVEKFVKTKKNEKIVIKINGGEQDKVKYTISDASKIRIISSSHLGVIIERISDYKEEVYICVYNKEYEELSDICYITCYNELISCEEIFLYKIGLNDKNYDTSIALGNGIYYLEFSTLKIDDNLVIEEESRQNLKENLEEFFATEIYEVEAKKLEICYKINVDIKKVFAYEIRKTMSFKIDRANFIYTFQRGI